jgi:NADH-quinone oxidoreductase subunit M
MGVYGFIRFNLGLFPEASLYFSPIVYVLALIGIVYTSLTAIRQTDLKRIIAYSSIAHMNLVVLGLFSFNVIGLEGAIIQSISHGFVSGALFLLVGVLYDRYHSRLLIYYGGLAATMPIYAGSFILFTMANIAFPGTSSFIGEFLLLLGTYKANTFCALIGAISVILSGGYSL